MLTSPPTKPTSESDFRQQPIIYYKRIERPPLVATLFETQVKIYLDNRISHKPSQKKNTMGQLKLGLQPPSTPTRATTLDTLTSQIRAFSGENITVLRGKPTEPDEDGVAFVTFEFDAVDGPAFKAQCRAWLDEGVVVSYRWTVDSAEEWPDF